jgi:hypothetical protein
VIDEKKLIAFFHVLLLFIIGKKHVLSKNKKFKIFGVKPILSLIHFIYAKSKKTFQGKKDRLALSQF